MSEDFSQRGFSFRLNTDASTACITGLCAALQIATEMVVFPDRVKVDDVSGLARLEYVNEELVRRVKELFSEGLSERDEADGITTALRLIEDNAAAIRRQIG